MSAFIYNLKDYESDVKAVAGHFEGCRLIPYVCPAGKLTVGYGHVILANEGHLKKGITKDQADDLFLKDLNIAKNHVVSLTNRFLTGKQLAALTSFVFNCGVNNYKSSTLLRQLNQGKGELSAAEVSEVKKQLTRWVNGGGKRLQGLVARRACEGHIFTGGTVEELKKRNWFAGVFKLSRFHVTQETKDCVLDTISLLTRKAFRYGQFRGDDISEAEEDLSAQQ